MDDLAVLEKLPVPVVPKTWDFKKADKNFDKEIHNWRRLTIDVVSELWVFYNKLAFRTGGVDKGADAPLPTWHVWLENKGIGKDTPLRHFKALGWLPADKAQVVFDAEKSLFWP